MRNFSLILLLVAAASAQEAQPDLKAVKADFIAGEKTLFFDDLTDMTGDEPPPHWKVRDGAVTLKVGGSVRQLTTSTPRVRLTPMLQGLPANFTVEIELKFENPAGQRSTWYFHDATWDGPLGPEAALFVLVEAREGSLYIWVRHSVAGQNVEELAQVTVPADISQPVKEAIWIQDGRLRVYINGQRMVDVNQVKLPKLTGAECFAEAGEGAIGYRTVRFAESTPDFSRVIASAGRYITHGIHFDTDSDRLKPESAAVIRSIARGLETNPSLKLHIEGHTDSTGNAAHNLDLSKRRAQRTILFGKLHSR